MGGDNKTGPGPTPELFSETLKQQFPDLAWVEEYLSQLPKEVAEKVGDFIKEEINQRLAQRISIHNISTLIDWWDGVIDLLNYGLEKAGFSTKEASAIQTLTRLRNVRWYSKIVFENGDVLKVAKIVPPGEQNGLVIAAVIPYPEHCTEQGRVSNAIAIHY